MTAAGAGLDAALIGAWRLNAYVIEDPRGAVIDVPFGPAPQGALLYTDDGRVTVHAMASHRPRCETARITACPPDVKVSAFDTYFGYIGTYDLDGDRITHHVEVGSFPDWSGNDLHRTVAVRGDVLILRGSEPAPRIPVLTWRRDLGGDPCTPR